MMYVKEFVKRGLVSAWGGPVILAIVYACLGTAEVITSLTVSEVVLAIISSVIMAFIAGGISFIYHVEKLPLAMATLIQMAVLYFDYLLVYLINGWVPAVGVGWFTLIFVPGFTGIWLLVYFCAVKPSVRKLNEKLNIEK